MTSHSDLTKLLWMSVDAGKHRVCDIDILVRDEQKYDAVKALLQTGFNAHHEAENISHETSLHKNNVWIDLHWHLMRPGRTRINLNDYLFEQQQTFGEFTGLSNEASLLVMLIHPAITKYVNGSVSSLRHLVDIHRLAQCDDINWERLKDVLEQSGTRTAAWASLTWLQMLSDEPMYEDLTNQLKPGGLKARWLHYWMGKDLNKKLAEHRTIIRACFSLVLQDNLRDVFNAVSALKEEKQKAVETCHSTAKQAATLGKNAKVKNLILTHFSARYKNEIGHLKEAVEIHNSVITAKDLLEIEIK